MADITKRQALEAYNLIMNYCRQLDDCENCIFALENCAGCIFDEGHTLNYPSNWQTLELD